MVGTLEARPDSLAGHLDDPETGNTGDPTLGLVRAETLFHELLQLPAVGHLLHIDEVYNDETSEIPQAKFLSDNFSGLDIRFESCRF